MTLKCGLESYLERGDEPDEGMSDEGETERLVEDESLLPQPQSLSSKP